MCMTLLGWLWTFAPSLREDKQVPCKRFHRHISQGLIHGSSRGRWGPLAIGGLEGRPRIEQRWTVTGETRWS